MPSLMPGAQPPAAPRTGVRPGAAAAAVLARTVPSVPVTVRASHTHQPLTDQEGRADGTDADPSGDPGTDRRFPAPALNLQQQEGSADLMEWCQLYANLRDNQRLQRAEDDAQAGWLFMVSIMYCTAAEENGFIPDSQIRRFGVTDADTKIKALQHEGLWIDDRITGGNWIDPEVWSEERNLSDMVERKRKADRERQRARRAAAKAGPDRDPDPSRDSRATRRVTSREASATGLVTRRGDTSDGPAYPQDTARSFSSRPVNMAGEDGCGSGSVARQSGDVSRDSRAYKRGEKKEPPLTPPQAGGTSRCATHKARPKPWCDDCNLPPLLPVPDHCGQCSPSRRIEHPDTGADLGPCPACHPSVVRSA